MRMKDICKFFLSELKDNITDSFYDDDGGDYVELYIENDDNEDLKLQIEIGNDYFGFSYRDYDETYSYDENAKGNANAIVDKINKIINGELCLITIYRGNQCWSVDFIVETANANDSCVNELINKVTEDSDSGYAEVILWGESEYETYKF